MDLDWLFHESDRPALIDGASGRMVSHSALGRRARELASRFGSRRGADGRGERVALLCRSRHEVFECVWACARVGAVLVPLNWRLSEPELDAIVADCAPRVLVTDTGYRDVAGNLAARYGVEVLVDLDEVGEDAGEDDEVAGGDGEVAGGDTEVAGGVDEVAGEGAEVAGGDADGYRPGLDDTAMLLYTSGTTGTPKGVMLSWRQIASNAATTATLCDLGPEDRTLVFLPLFHTGGLNCLAIPMLSVGGAVVVMEHFDAARALALMAAYRVSAIIGVPTIYELLHGADMGRAELPALRWALMGGAPPPPGLMDDFAAMGYPLAQGYGLTEVGPNCFTLGLGEGVPAGSVGRPVPGSEARILADDGAPIEGPGVGELCLAGAHVTQGYWNRPALTAEVLDEDGFLHTGDIARRDEDGYYYIVGRKKDMYISGGENVYPAEVERALLEHPRVAEAAVVGVPDARWGEVGLAFVVLRRGARDGAPSPALAGDDPDDPMGALGQELGSFLRQRLAAYKVPKRWQILDALPQTSTGKVAKAELRRQYS